MAATNSEITYDTTQDALDPEAHMYHNIDAGHKKIGVIKFDGTAGEAQVLVTDKEIIITNMVNGIAVGEVGSVISGPVHFLNNPSDISFNSFWRFNDELLTTLPSTIYTPIPVLRYRVPPYIKNLQRMAKLIAGR
jgi:hypothetical protein